jgi:glycine oxidase
MAIARKGTETGLQVHVCQFQKMIIVGAGIIGLSCAWALARAGRRVTVFDKGAAAREASWAGAGMLAPGGEFEADSEAARMAVRSLKMYPGFVEELAEETGIEIDFRRCGAIELGSEEELSRVAALRAALGIQSRPCPHRGQPARFYPGDALVDPRQLTEALILACKPRGVSVREHEAVVRIAENGLFVETAQARYEDDEGVVIAAGAWSSGLYKGLPETRPVRGHLVSWRMAPGFLPSILRGGGTYAMQRSSGVVIAGSSTEEVGFQRAIDEGVVGDIVRRAEALVPELRGVPVFERWNGFRPGVAGEGPVIGRVPGTAVFLAFGHYRNGILLAPETGRILAELLAA